MFRYRKHEIIFTNFKEEEEEKKRVGEKIACTMLVSVMMNHIPIHSKRFSLQISTPSPQNIFC